jgi:general secretion pathway protein D
VRIVAIERLNSILVVTKSPDVFNEVSQWIEKLDTPSSTSNLKTYVYQVENNTAVQIAQILAELYQDGTGLPSSMTGDFAEGDQQQGRLAQDARAASQQRSAFRQDGFVDSDRMDTRGVGGNLAMRELGPALSKDSRSQIRAIVAGNVRIVVNEFNNSLIIQGTEADIQFILETVEQLDTLPRQVVIEARIYAVELRDELSFGVSAFLQARGTQTGPATIGSISAPGENQSGGILSVTTKAIIGQEREVVAILNALRSKTNVEILDAPTVMALDGTPASINVGAEVPVTTASYGNPLQSGTTNFINTIQFRPTGTTLLIVPRISASGIVTMDVVIEVSNATGPSLTPTINRTYSQSSFIVRDGQTIGIAGLMSDSYSMGKSRVPVVGDIPILGALFGTTERTVSRRELVIFITPKVIRTLPTAAELTLEFRRALRHAYDFISAQEEIDRETIEKHRKQEVGDQ